MQLGYAAPQPVQELLAALGRTEDVKFSPSRRRLAVAAFAKAQVVILDIDISAASAGKRISLTHAVAIASPQINQPHGVDFIDEDTIIVASRDGKVCIFALPPATETGRVEAATPLGVIETRTPGSVLVLRGERNRCEVLICNNYVHAVTKHRLDLSNGCSVGGGTPLLKKWLDIPDGLAVSGDRQWIAVSNHGTSQVFIYASSPDLNESSDPDGILRCVAYPHGLRFAGGDALIFVADAGAPYVHVFARNGGSWRGVQNPVLSLRVMDDEVYRRGRYNPTEGGPKGIDLDPAAGTLVTTSEYQTLAFFDVTPILQCATALNLETAFRCVQPDGHDQAGLELAHELERTRALHDAVARAGRAEARAAVLELALQRARLQASFLASSMSWRITAPLRWLSSGLRRLQPGNHARRNGG